jgi:hypothetical protein
LEFVCVVERAVHTINHGPGRATPGDIHLADWARALRRAEAAHAEREKRTGQTRTGRTGTPSTSLGGGPASSRQSSGTRGLSPIIGS